MNRLLAPLMAIAVSIGTTALLRSGHGTAANPGEVNLNADGAYRDGIFVGHLAAQRGEAPRPLVGRWSSERDRASFAAGYRRGYDSK